MCCSVLLCAAVYCSEVPYAAVCCSVLQCVAACCSVLQCVAVCCCVLQGVAVCYTCVAVFCSGSRLTRFGGKRACNIMCISSRDFI